MLSRLWVLWAAIGVDNLTAPPIPRSPGSGLTTLAVLAGVLLLAVLTLTLQTRTTADLRILARLTDDLETRTAENSLHDRLRPMIAEAMAGTRDTQLKLDSTSWS